MGFHLRFCHGITATIANKGNHWIKSGDDTEGLKSSSQNARASHEFEILRTLDWTESQPQFNYVTLMEVLPLKRERKSSKDSGRSDLFVWGRGGDGQLGNGQLKDAFTPLLNAALKGLNLRGIFSCISSLILTPR
jgi:hypothetical protein